MTKRLMLILAFILCCSWPVLADTVTLTSPEVLTVPTAAKLDWRLGSIDAQEGVLTVYYRWRDSDGHVIDRGRGDRWERWECSGTCFTDVFSFQVRSQDVGTAIGAGLRQLIWNKFRADVLTGSNNGTFEE